MSNSCGSLILRLYHWFLSFTLCTCLYVSSPSPAGLVGKILDLYINSSASFLVFVPVWWFSFYFFILHSGNVEEQ